MSVLSVLFGISLHESSSPNAQKNKQNSESCTDSLSEVFCNFPGFSFRCSSNGEIDQLDQIPSDFKCFNSKQSQNIGQDFKDFFDRKSNSNSSDIKSKIFQTFLKVVLNSVISSNCFLQESCFIRHCCGVSRKSAAIWHVVSDDNFFEQQQSL